MLVICEDCAKKYNVDENRIKGEKARFSCYECGHIIVVEKPKAVEPPPETPETVEAPETAETHEPPETFETRPMTDEEAMASIIAMDSPEEQQDNSSSTSEGKGSSSSTFFMLAIITTILVVGGVIVYMYLQ